MIRPSPEVVKALASVSRQFPDVRSFLEDWKRHELEALPYALQNQSLAQGRCQVLSELVKLVLNAPDIAAKPNGGMPFNSTHTDRSV